MDTIPEELREGPASEAEATTEKKTKKEAFASLAMRMMFDISIANQEAFLLCYRQLTKHSSTLCNLWIQQFVKVCEKEKGAEVVRQVKKTLPQRMVDFLRIWMSYYPEDFSTTTFTRLINNITAYKDQLPSGMAVVNELKLLFVKSHRARSSRFLAPTGAAERRDDGVDNTFCILDISPAELARELTLIEFDIFGKVTPRELLSYCWKAQAENIKAIIARFNEVSYWVASSILLSKPKEQLSVLKKFIELARECLLLNNFNSTMEILSGLNNSSIVRLKKLWEALPERFNVQFRAIEEVMAPQQNFIQCRRATNQRPPPKFPYFALLLKDLTFIREGNVTYLPDGNINFELLQLLHQQIKHMLQCQATPYGLTRNPKVSAMLMHLKYIDEESMYAFSCSQQPSVWGSTTQHLNTLEMSTETDSIEQDTETSDGTDSTLITNTDTTDGGFSDDDLDDSLSSASVDTMELSDSDDAFGDFDDEGYGSGSSSSSSGSGIRSSGGVAGPGSGIRSSGGVVGSGSGIRSSGGASGSGIRSSSDSIGSGGGGKSSSGDGSSGRSKDLLALKLSQGDADSAAASGGSGKASGGQQQKKGSRARRKEAEEHRRKREKRRELRRRRELEELKLELLQLTEQLYPSPRAAADQQSAVAAASNAGIPCDDVEPSAAESAGVEKNEEPEIAKATAMAATTEEEEEEEKKKRSEAKASSGDKKSSREKKKRRKSRKDKHGSGATTGDAASSVESSPGTPQRKRKEGKAGGQVWTPKKAEETTVEAKAENQLDDETEAKTITAATNAGAGMARRESKEIGSAGGSSSLSSEPSAESEASAAAAADRKKKKKKESALDEMLKRRSAKIREAKEKAEKDTAAASVAAAAAAADSPTAKRRSFLFRSTSYSVRSSTGSASSSPTSSPPSSSPPSTSFFGTLRNRRSRGEEEVVRHHSGDGFQIAQEREKERERMALMMGYSSSDTSVATTAASGGTAQSENESDKERSDSETETTMRIRAASVYGSGEHAAVAAAAALVPQKSKEKRKKRTASTRIQRVKEGPSKWLQRTSSLTNIKPEEGQAPAEGKEKEKDKEKGEKAKEEVKTIVVLEVAEEAHAQTSNGKKEKEKKNKKEKKERKQEKRKKKEKSRQAMDAIPRSESEDGLAVGRAGKAKAQAEEVSPPTNTEQPAAAPHKAESTEEAGSVQPPPSVTAQPPPEPKSETELKPELERASTEPEPAPAPTAAVETPSAAEGEKDDERMRELTALAKAVTKAVASSVKDAVVESSRPRPIQQHQRSNTETSLAIINQFATQASLPASGGPLSPRKRSGRSANAKDRKRRGTSALLLNTIASATPATATTASPTPHECKGAAPSAKMTELFALAEQQVEKFFTQMTYSSKLGFVKILDDRYLLLRSSSLHVELLNAVTNTFGLSAAAAAAITPAATTAAAAGGAASGSMLSISCPPVGVDTTSPASPPTSRPPLQRNSSERSVPTGTANSWQRQTTSESANSFSSISNLWKRLSSSLETPTKEIVAHDEAERKAKAAKGRGLIEPFTPETASGGAASAGPTPETASSSGAGKRARRERDRAADDSSTVDAYGFLPRQLSTSGTNVPLLTPRRKLISDEAEKMRIGRSATVTAYDSSSLFASAASLSSGSAVSLSSSLSSASSLPSATRPYYASLPPALRQKRDFERKFVYTFARSLGRKDAQLFSKRAGFIAVMQQTLLGSNAAGGSALVAATSASLSSSPSSSATLSAAGGLPVMNAAQAGLSPPWKRGRGSMIILPSSNEASSAIIPSGVGRDTEISIASGFLQLSFMGWSFVKVFPQSLLSRKINFRSAVAAAGGEKSSTHSKPDGADEPGRSVPRPVPGGSGLAQQQHNSGKKASTGETTTATGTGATGRAASDDSSKEKEINFYFLCDFNNSFEIQDSTAAAAAAAATALASSSSTSMSATSSASSSASASGASQLAASATATATAAGKEKEKEKQEKERKKKQRRRGSFILHSAKKKSLEEEEEREERDMRTAGPCCLINAGYISGWCETCLGLDVLAVEVLCRANGDECCRFLIAPPQMMKRHLLTFFSENNFDDRRRREVLEREGVLWSREWREKNAQEKKSSGGSGSSDAVPTMSTVLSGELLGPSTSSAAVGGGDESQRSAHSTTTTTAWRNKRLSVSLTLNTTKVDADENDDEFSLLKKFKDEDQRIEANARHGAEEAGEEGEPGEPGGEEQRQRLSEEKRMRAKLVRLEEMCVSRYRNVFHHMKGDVRKGIITLSEKPSYARRRKSRKSASERYVLLRAEGLAVTLRQSVESLFPRGTAQPEVKTFVDNFLYDFGQCLGRSDCAHLESRVLRPTAPNTSSSSTSTSSSLTSSTSSLIVSGVLHAERVQARLALLERLFGLSAVLSSTGWGLVNFAFSTDFLRSLGGREEKEKEKAKAKTMEPVESESGDSASMPIPSPSSSSSSSSSPASSFYLKISVAQSVEAVEFLSKHAHKNESEGEGENESESEESSNPQANGKRRGPAPACLVLSGYIDGYIKHTVGSCPSARGAPLHLVPEDLVTVEVACKSQGAECCEFVTAHIDHIADVIKREAAASTTVTTLDDGTTTTGVVGLLKIVRGRHKSGRGWLAHCLETSSSSSSSAATPIKK